jgi:hypothetical protein
MKAVPRRVISMWKNAAYRSTLASLVRGSRKHDIVGFAVATVQRDGSIGTAFAVQPTTCNKWTLLGALTALGARLERSIEDVSAEDSNA